MKRPWFKWYHSDWRGDPKLKMCSFHAKGVWIECINVMAEMEEFGKLMQGGKPLSNEDIARLIGGDKSEVIGGIDELLEKGAASKDERGVIYCRRMVREAEKRKKAENYGKQGGNPSLLYSLSSYDLFTKKLEARYYRAKGSLIPPVTDLLENKAFYDTWEGFVEHRRGIKAPLTNRAADAILGECAEWGCRTAITALRESIKRGWRGVFAPRDSEQHRSTLK